MSAESVPPGPPNDPRLEEALNALLAGELDGSGRDRLLERLKHDPAARETYGTMVEMEAMLHHEFPRLPEFREPAPLVRRPRRLAGARSFSEAGKEKSRVPVFVGVAAALVLSLAGWWFLRPSPNPVLVEAHGEWSWLDGSGTKRPLAVGGKLQDTGALVTEGAGAYAKLRFPDASTAVLSGRGELRVPRGSSKRLMLEGGILEVEMSPQPVGRPALVETPAAKVEVVGTRFSVDATEARTTVAVTEGKVKFQRLADGETVEIPRDRVATASLDARGGLELRKFSEAPADWREVHPGGGVFAAQPFRAGTVGDRPVIHHGVIFRSEGAGLAGLGPDSRIRVKFRVADPDALVRIFIVCRGAKGQFGGNRQEELRASSLAADEDGWRVYEGPVEAMGVLVPPKGFEVSGMRLTDLIVSVLNPSDHLEISDAEIRN